MDSILTIPGPSIHTPKLTAEDVIGRLRDASRAIHGNARSTCLLEAAADVICRLLGKYEAAVESQAVSWVRAQEAMSGVVKAQWWNTPGEDYGMTDPAEALDDVCEAEIVRLDGHATVETIFGFWLDDPGERRTGSHREHWFPTQAEAEAELGRIRESIEASDEANRRGG